MFKDRTQPKRSDNVDDEIDISKDYDKKFVEEQVYAPFVTT